MQLKVVLMSKAVTMLSPVTKSGNLLVSGICWNNRYSHKNVILVVFKKRQR